MNHLTQKAQDALNSAMECARELGHTYIGSEHLLLGLCSTQGSIAAHLLEQSNIHSAQIKDAIVLMTGVGSRSHVTAGDITPRVQKIIENSAKEAIKFGQSHVGTEHLLMALLQENAGVALHLLEECGIHVEELKNNVQQFLTISGKAQNAAIQAREHHAGIQGERAIAKKQSLLATYSQDLNDLAKKGEIDPMIGRDNDMARLIRILSRRNKNNPCLVGDPGVGKTAVVEGLAHRIVRGDVPEHMRNIRILSLDIPALLAGAKYRGEFEERFKNVLSELKGRDDTILFIDEIHILVGAGAAEGAIDAANMIKPALARGELRLIGATTHEEYHRYIEKDAALERRFQPIKILPPDRDACIHILQGIREQYERFHQIEISDDAIVAAVDLSTRYIPDRNLPDKAIDLLDEGCAMLRIRVKEEPESLHYCREQLEAAEHDKENAILRQDFEEAAELRDRCLALREQESAARALWENEQSTKNPILLRNHIAELLTSRLGVPITFDGTQNAQTLMQLEKRLNERIIGQEEAIRTLCRAIQRNQAGLRDPNRPIGSFLFAGSSGVGKTELCRILAEELFDTSDALIRLDMSEYTERHSVSRLIGSPPGYVGFEEGGQLTERVRRRPYSVVLFDEIEKAHSDVYHLLLQILEDGVLSDSSGRSIDFKNTILILTSNVGEGVAGSAHRSGFSSLSVEQSVQQQKQEKREQHLKSIFRSEFLNRLDAIIWFSILQKEHLEKIALTLLQKTKMRLADMGITLTLDDVVFQELCCQENASAFGARPIRRAITDKIETLLATKLLLGELSYGDTAHISFKDQNFECSVFHQNKQAGKRE